MNGTGEIKFEEKTKCTANIYNIIIIDYIKNTRLFSKFIYQLQNFIVTTYHKCF